MARDVIFHDLVEDEMLVILQGIRYMMVVGVGHILYIVVKLFQCIQLIVPFKAIVSGEGQADLFLDSDGSRICFETCQLLADVLLTLP